MKKELIAEVIAELNQKAKMDYYDDKSHHKIKYYIEVNLDSEFKKIEIKRSNLVFKQMKEDLNSIALNEYVIDYGNYTGLTVIELENQFPSHLLYLYDNVSVNDGFLKHRTARRLVNAIKEYKELTIKEKQKLLNINAEIDFIEISKERINQSLTDDRFPSGVHYKKTIEQINFDQPNYISWLKKEIEKGNFKKNKEKIEVFLKHGE